MKPVLVASGEISIFNRLSQSFHAKVSLVVFFVMMLKMLSILRGGGIKDLPRIEIVVCIASLSVICFGAQLRTTHDKITIREKNIKKIRIESSRSTLDRIECGRQPVFMTSII